MTPFDFQGKYLRVFRMTCQQSGIDHKFAWLDRNGFRRPSDPEIRQSWGSAITNYTIQISRIEYASGYPENMLICSIYAINDDGNEIHVCNAAEYEFNLENSAFVDTDPFGKCSNRKLRLNYTINKQLLLELSAKYYSFLYDLPQNHHYDCPVCMETITRDEIYVTSCKHIFCKQCVMSMCEKSGPFQCPMCRKNLCSDPKTALEHATPRDLYNVYLVVISTKDAKSGEVTQNLQDLIGYALTSDDDRLLSALLHETEGDKEFARLYKLYGLESDDIIKNGGDRFIREFVYALLRLKYM